MALDPSLQVAVDVETFIVEQGIDEGAANDLRGCPPEVQQIVLAKGTLEGCRNKEGGLIARIKKARESTGVKTILCRHFQNGGFCQLGAACQFAHGEHELGRAPLPGLPQQNLQLSDPGLAQAMGQIGEQVNTYQNRVAQLANAGDVGVAMEVEAFIVENGIDEGAANDLRGCPLEVQRLVIEKGTLLGTRNPVGALISRIKKARESTGVKTILCRHFQNGGFCQLGASCQFAHGEQELGRAPLPGASPQQPLPSFSNPALPQTMDQIAVQENTYNTFESRLGDMGVALDVEAFLEGSGVSEAAANDLRGCPLDVQRLVMQQGTILGTQDASGALVARIQRAREFASAPLPGTAPQQNVGVSSQQTVGVDHSLLAQALSQMGMQPDQAAVAIHQLPEEVAVAMIVEAFIAEHGIDAAAANDLRGCPPDVQQLIINKLTGREQGNGGAHGNMQQGNGGAYGNMQGGCGAYGSIQTKPATVMRASPYKTVVQTANTGFVDPNVEVFIMQNGVDSGAANDLRGCPPEVQHMVISQGTLEGCRNKEGALISRIKKARQSTGVKTILCRHWQNGGFCQLGASCQFAHGEHELGVAPLPQMQPQQQPQHQPQQQPLHFNSQQVQSSAGDPLMAQLNELNSLLKQT